MKKKLHKLIRRGKKAPLKAPENGSETTKEPVPRITNETVAAHREEVLSTARKYIYPLQHSKHKIVLITTTLFIAATIGFFSYCIVALYRLKSTSSFIYGVTQVVPFPVVKTGPHFVAYENYLFELRRYIHYYHNQQKVDFNDQSGKEQLNSFRKRAIDKIINDAYVKDIARQHKISVSNQEVDDEIRLVQAQNRLGGSDKVFEDVLKEYWGWSVSDLKRSLRQQLLAQKVVATLDTATKAKAEAAYSELQGGADFAAIAKKYSDDPTAKDNGGEFNFIDRTNREVDARTVDTLFSLKPGEYSKPINTGYSLEIVKAIEKQGDKVRGARIVLNYKDISSYVNQEKDKQKTRVFIKL